MPITTIICSQCNALLRPGTPGASVEYKLCPQCVIKTHPPSSKVKEVENAQQHGHTNAAIVSNAESIIKRFKSIHIEIPYRVVNDKMTAVITLTDYYHNPFAELSFTADKLREIANDLDRLEEHAEDDIPIVGDSKA